MNRKLFIFLTLIICFILLPVSSFAQASTISVKLVNYFGNKSSINLETVGNYKVANGNVRLSGADRFEVANNVASSGWSKADTVIVVNYVAFADALAAAPLAYKLNAPILLTQANNLTAVTKSKIEELSPENIIIIGGAGSVSANVEKQLKSIIPSVSRLGGKDRFEVASEIASKLGNPDTAIVTNGMVFADALSIAPYAAQKGYPILLTTKDKLPDKTKGAMEGKKRTLIIGGEGSVSKKVASQLPTTDVDRIGGSNRFEVSANIIRQLNLDASNAFLSTGMSFADALTGSVLAAKQGAPMLLTIPSELPDSIASVIREKGTNSFTILGGSGSVNDSVVSKLPNEVWITPGTTHSVKVENGRLVLFKGSNIIKDFGQSSFTLIPNVYGAPSQIRLNDKSSYIGKMEFTIENGAYVRPINRDIPFEDYLKGVVPREMPASWSLEALKAQAVAARTYSISDVGKTVLDSQAYQVYGGYTWGSGKAPYHYEGRTNQAVDETAGEVLRSNGRVIGDAAVYSSSNGGHTESNSNEWGSAQLSYLTAKADPYDAKADTRWEITLNKIQIDLNGKSLENPGHWWSSVSEVNSSYTNGIKTWLQKNGYPGVEIKIASITDFTVLPEKTTGQRSKNANIKFDFLVKDSSGKYVFEVNPETGKNQIKTFTMNQTLPVSTFRTMFGTMNFRSTVLDPPEITNDTIKIKGRGFGHGVGMSQTGALKMAQEGMTYKQILNFYYPTTTLGK